MLLTAGRRKTQLLRRVRSEGDDRTTACSIDELLVERGEVNRPPRGGGGEREGQPPRGSGGEGLLTPKAQRPVQLASWRPPRVEQQPHASRVLILQPCTPQNKAHEHNGQHPQHGGRGAAVRGWHSSTRGDSRSQDLNLAISKEPSSRPAHASRQHCRPFPI